MSAVRCQLVCALLVTVGMIPVSVGSARADTGWRLTQRPRQAARQEPGSQRRRGQAGGARTLHSPPGAGTQLVPALNGQVVYDPALNVTWLADANLPATQSFEIPGVNASGSMSYATAQAWVAAMNAKKYMGRTDWQLPTFPRQDSTCGSKNKINFGYGCHASAPGSLYYRGLRLRDPNTAVPMPPSKTGPFSNFQPYLYWTNTPNIHHPQNKGFETFSFASGFHGANVEKHVMYVLPMIRGKLPGTPPASGKGLKVNPGGLTVYDPVDSVTWLANANLAASDTLGVPGINEDGSMSHQTALAFIAAMNADKRYAQSKPWELPFVNVPDPSCAANKDFGFGCTGSPLGGLYYKQLKLQRGQPVVPTPNVRVGPFVNLQPYLYWGCGAASPQLPCEAKPPAPNFAWSFSFGNGFQGTDVEMNELYVMVYHPGPATTPPVPACSGTRCK